MDDLDGEANGLLVAARARGARAVGPAAIPSGMDNATAYIGLIDRTLELATLIQTEERDLKVIESHYKIEIARITAAFREVEIAMMADFKRDETLKQKTFEMIELLIGAGQHDIALEFYKRMTDSFQRPALEAIIEHRNNVAASTGSRIRLK
jgi:hypothetical protein